MIARHLAAAALLLLPRVASADMLLTGVGGPVSAAPSFVGVADKETTISNFWGLVAASSATAAAHANAVDLSNNSTTCTAVKVLSTGQLDVSAGLYCNGGTQTVTAWCATNCQVAANDAVARITTTYGQIGGASLASLYAAAPGFILSGVAGKPTGMCVQARSSQLAGTVVQITGAQSFGATYERYARFTSFAATLSDNGSSFAVGSPGTANLLWGQLFGATGNIEPAATDGASVSDFTHFHRTLLTLPGAAGTASMYVDGGAPTTGASAFGNTSGPTASICGYAGNFAAAFFTGAWTDPTLVGATAAQAVTNLTTVPLP